MPVLGGVKTFARAGIIAAVVAGFIAPTVQARPVTARIAPVKVFLSCTLAWTSENLALALTITNSSKSTVPKGASVSYTQAVGKPDQQHTAIAANAIAPGGQLTQTIAPSGMTGGPCTAWFMSSPPLHAPNAM